MAILEVLLLLSLAITTALFLTSFLHRNSRREFPNLPPGRLRGLPFIGETLSFLKPHSSTTLGSYIVRNVQRYGKIFHANILGEPTIISVDPEFNLFVLRNEGTAFVMSPPKSILEIFGRNSLMTAFGETHHRLRSIVVTFINDTKLKTRLLPELDSLAVELLDSWKHRPASFPAMEEAKKFAFNLMVKHVLDIEAGTPETENLRKEYRTFMSGMASLPLNIPGTSYHRALQSRSTILRQLEKKLDKQMERAKTTGEGDDLMSLVSRQKDLSREVMLDLLLDILFAGHETISTAIALIIYFLSSCPKAIQQLREEHQAIVDSKRENGLTTKLGLSWDDYKRMQFTHHVVNEALRLGNVVKFVYRKSIVDLQYKGFDIPCGWKIVPILSSGHLDHTTYENPQEFNPWRWERTPHNQIKKKLMPFGGGPRLCAGEELARVEIALFIHHLVQRYDWELAEPDHPICFSFLDFPKGLPIKVRPLRNH